MLFDVTEKVYKKGDKLTLHFEGHLFEIEVVGSTVMDFERKYLAKFADGSQRWLTTSELQEAESKFRLN